MQAQCGHCGNWNLGPPGTLVACYTCKTPIQIPAAPYAANPTPTQALGLQQQTSGRCIAALVLGIVSFIPYLGLVTGILAIFFAVTGMKQVNANPQLVKGKGLAIAGLVLGIVGFALWFLIMLAATLFVIVSDSLGTPSPTPSFR